MITFASIQITTVLIGLALTLIGVIGVLLGVAAVSLRVMPMRSRADQPIDRSHLDSRIEEVQRQIRVFDRRIRTYAWSSGVLTMGQVVIGAGLASSFIQEAFSKNFIGVMGVVVLVTTSINEHFRPKEATRIMRIKVGRLRAALWGVEDGRNMRSRGEQNAPSEDELLKCLRHALIENSIEEGLEARNEAALAAQLPDQRAGS